ncbi:helix-turn-helix domain-containing protein [Leptobacterium flavescens]|uniref:Helix-turn-helix domain-containing protein n=1 Tax=Leptobacterium flavescens TaxID=472055 RepID=A0A6P0UQP7_9FLAO|nr:helix-turn-helix domain-containing protein [Leptobacterium flavescens]NER12726.1 helix-turn-helix domain-containing protein [Leptobacterium flavescens]
MKMKRVGNILVCLCFLIVNIGFSQIKIQNKASDSLLAKGYEELLEKYHYFRYEDATKAHDYITAYLYKAKKNNDSLKIAAGFHWLGRISDPEKEQQYADSIILVTRNKQNERYPAVGYANKGYWAYYFGAYNKALDFYLKAYEFAVKNENLKIQREIKHNLASLRTVCGFYEEAHQLHLEDLEFIESQTDYKIKDRVNYLAAISNLSSSFIQLKKLDSADIYIKKGILESIALEDSLRYYDFVSTSGYNEYYKGNYKAALDSLNKAFLVMADQNSRINHYLYKGRIAKDLNNIEEAISHFQKLDSIYEVYKDPVRELTEVYQTFINYYKEKGDVENQLKYVDKLLTVDSILDANFTYLSTNITKKYDIPQIVSQKETLIGRLEKEKEQNYIKIGVLGVLLLVSGSLFYYYYRKQRAFKRKFGYLMNDQKSGVKTFVSDEVKTKPLGITGISEEIIKKIIDRLRDFEQQNKFLDPSLTLNSMSKKLHTNSNYLSKIINHYEQKNFSNYINDLRIDYTVEQLKTNRQFRLYSIKGIAEEIGFNNAESFSKAFYKRTGIYPSYFVKELEKQIITK